MVTLCRGARAQRRADTDDGEYEGVYSCEDIAKHCSGCGKMWCGSCQRSLTKHIVRKYRDDSVTAQDVSCPMCRQRFVSSNDEEEFMLRWSLVHDRTPGQR
jgi:uncharacterized CHY-type Zn-finger protein